MEGYLRLYLYMTDLNVATDDGPTHRMALRNYQLIQDLKSLQRC